MNIIKELKWKILYYLFRDLVGDKPNHVYRLDRLMRCLRKALSKEFTEDNLANIRQHIWLSVDDAFPELKEKVYKKLVKKVK